MALEPLPPSASAFAFAVSTAGEPGLRETGWRGRVGRRAGLEDQYSIHVWSPLEELSLITSLAAKGSAWP